MSSEIRICQFFDLTTSNGRRHRYQNYFIGEAQQYLGQSFAFAPFQADGALASLNGENQQLRVLFPNLELVIRLVEEGDGNRLSVLALTTAWLTGSGQIATTFTDYFVGTGSSFSEDTVELRFRSSMDSVGAGFPSRTLTSENVGILPLNAELYLR
jgi:phage-related protein